METNVLIRSRTNFTAVPNSFAQDKSLSFEAKGLALFLQSLPHDWKIYPSWIQKEYGITEWAWRKLSKELRSHGCLELRTGGANHGSLYVFDLWKAGDDPDPETAKKPFSSNLPRRRKTRPRGKQHPYKETGTIYKKETRTTRPSVDNLESPVFVSLKNVEKGSESSKPDSSKALMNEAELVNILKGYGVNKAASMKWIQQYGLETVVGKHRMLQEQLLGGRSIDNMGGWIKRALEQNWKPGKKKATSSYPIPNAQETNEMLNSMFTRVA